MYDIERIRKEFKEVCASQNVGVNVPIDLNGRLTRTLGRVHYYYEDEVCVPEWVEFSKQFIATASDKSIRSVIEHEAAHYITTVETGENHGHDGYFKSVCARIGCKNDKTTTQVERIIEEKKVYRYQIYCSTCKKFVGDRNRKCSIVNHPEEWTCGYCGQPTLSIQVNW